MHFGKKLIYMILAGIVWASSMGLFAGTALAASSGFHTSGLSLPTDRKEGVPFTVKGTIRSQYKITVLYAGVVNSEGKWVKGVYRKVRPNAKQYHLDQLDDKISFKKLHSGKYHYRIRVKNVRGASATLVNRAFKVTVLKLSGNTAPGALYYGTPFVVKGTVHSSSKITSLCVGVKTASKKWKKGSYAMAKPNATSYDISRLDRHVPISRLSGGTYYYCIVAKDAAEKKILLQKKFTVSKFHLSSARSPEHLSAGSGFAIKGKIKSALKMNQVKVGVQSKTGSWQSGSSATVNPKKTSYAINELDQKIKFGKLKQGTYYYSVWCRDVSGKHKTLLKKKFTVSVKSASSSSGTLSSNGKTLSYKAGLISKTIGAQKVSGPCGIYAMAYSRAVMDGTFTRGKYSSVYKRLISQYGHGTYCAYWYEAGGDSVYYMTAKSCYKAALRQIVSGKPCIINVYNGNTGNQHYLTVIGYTAGTTYDNVTLNRLIVLDPGYGCKKYVSQMNYYNHSSPQCITF